MKPEIKTSEEILFVSEKDYFRDKKWISLDSLKEIINTLTLTGYKGNPEGYINAKHLKEILNIK